MDKRGEGDGDGKGGAVEGDDEEGGRPNQANSAKSQTVLGQDRLKKRQTHSRIIGNVSQQ